MKGFSLDLSINLPMLMALAVMIGTLVRWITKLEARIAQGEVDEIAHRSDDNTRFADHAAKIAAAATEASGAQMKAAILGERVDALGVRVTNIEARKRHAE